MAWLDNRIWCHPKITNVPKPTRWEYAAGLAYSDGFNTEGHLTAGQLKTIECTQKDRKLLIEVGLWDDDENGGVFIHDWDEYNGKRDARKAADRERKRAERAKTPKKRPQDSPQDVRQTFGNVSAGQTVDGPQGSPQPVLARARADARLMTEVTEELTRAVPVASYPDDPGPDLDLEGPDDQEPTALDLEYIENIRTQIGRALP